MTSTELWRRETRDGADGEGPGTRAEDNATMSHSPTYVLPRGDNPCTKERRRDMGAGANVVLG